MKHERIKPLAALGMLVAFAASVPSVARAETAPESPGAPKSPESPESKEPFAFGDFTWLNGNSRQKDFPLDGKVFSGEFTLDTNYVYDFARPVDHTLTGSTNTGRTQEVQVEQIGVGGDLHYNNVRGRIFTQFGMYSTMTPRNDASPGRGQWNLGDAYKYISEAYGGYHWDTWNGINLDVGLFMSYIGLCSYYNYENWIYQMSYVSANTPWFFNGVRVQTFPSDKLKIEYWLINGWQSYGMFNEMPGLGFEVLYRPKENLSFVTNFYFGHDATSNSSNPTNGQLGTPGRTRFHSDNSVQYKYYDEPKNLLTKSAFSLTVDLGCENGGGVSCWGGGGANAAANNAPSQNFLGIMFYDRWWFGNDKFAVTAGAGAIRNPGRYLVVLPPINGATAVTQAGPNGQTAFTESPGNPFVAWDSSLTFDYMPSQNITFRLEYIHRSASAPYFAGPGGITPPNGNQLQNGTYGGNVAGFTPDLQTYENRVNLALMVRI